jgi:hypothetical protein
MASFRIGVVAGQLIVAAASGAFAGGPSCFQGWGMAGMVKYGRLGVENPDSAGKAIGPDGEIL